MPGAGKRTVMAALAALATGATLTSCSGGAAGTSEPEVVEYQADYPTYSTIQQLCSAATVVVRGREVSSEVRRVNTVLEPGDDAASNPTLGAPNAEAPPTPEPLVTTVSTFEVSNVLHGTGVNGGSRIEVAQMGGLLGETLYQAQQYSLVGGERVLFLSITEGTPAFLLNPTQAGYQVGPASTLVAANENPLKGLVNKLVADESLC